MIKINHLIKSFQNETIFSDLKVVLNEQGKIYTIIGDSGVGKSTLLNILFGLDHQYEGSYQLFGKNAKDFSDKEWNQIRSNDMQVVYQDYKLIDSFTVEETLFFASNSSKTNFSDELKMVGLEKYHSKRVHELSGGQKQRLSFTRAIVNNPKILLLDEPTGNLDDKNAQRLMSLIKNIISARNTMIVMITHDPRIIKYSDVVFELKNHKLIELSKRDSTGKQDVNHINRFEKSLNGKTLKYLRNKFTTQISSKIFTLVPILIIFTLFTLGFSAFKANTIDQYKSIFQGLSDRSIIVDIGSLEAEYFNDNTAGILPPNINGKLFLSEEDLKVIKKIPNVSKASFISNSSYSNLDLSGNELVTSLTQSDFKNKVRPKSFSNFYFQFVTLPTASDFFQYYNKYQINILEGEVPKDGSEEVLVPDIYAYSIVDDVKEIVNKKIKLDVEPFNTPGEHLDKEYVVSGVYETNFQRFIQEDYSFYLPRYKDNSWKEDLYNSLIENYAQASEQEKERNKDIYSSKEALYEALGDGESAFLVVAKEKNDIPAISEQLSEMYPFREQTSYYSLASGEGKKILINFYLILYGGSLIIVLIFSLIIIFMTKYDVLQRSQELAILFSLGYDKRTIKKFIFLENLIYFYSSLIISFIFLYFLNWLLLSRFSYSSLFINLFSVENIVSIVFFVFIIAIISTLWGIHGVSQRNLIRYLNQR